MFYCERAVVGLQRIALVSAMLAITPAAVAAQQPGEPEAGTMRELALAEGKSEYIVYCRTCHGDAGKGDGSMAKILTKKPADLTSIAARNGGQFPYWRTFNIIAGDVETAGHDMFQMPRFWSRFEKQAMMPGYAPAQMRLLALTHYVESLQVPPQPEAK
ncbi:MAG: hypothetical protein APF80_16200 [Alphaproteobacteria bacterium BRH_c36]|nr:MAG: hypothetical protein APF80_16200 [Alphaproteobacteria bacterium BRH_c36]